MLSAVVAIATRLSPWPLKERSNLSLYSLSEREWNIPNKQC